LGKNCLLKHVIEEMMEGMKKVVGRRGRRRKQLLDDINPLTPELNLSAQRCLPRLFTGDFNF
jgi:hypothetical protein